MAGNGKQDTTALAVVEQFTPLTRAPEQVQAMIEAFAENMGSDGISVFQLGSLAIPAGGGITWEIANPLTNETETVKEVEAVVLHHQPVRQYYKGAYDGTNSPPDCASADNVTGRGSPGGTCATCPNAVFGSDGNKGQACQQRRWLLLLTPHSGAPMFLNLPPTALKGWSNFMLHLSCAGIKASRVVIGIGLEKAQNSSGITYSRPTFRLIGEIPEDKLAIVDLYKNTAASMVSAAVLANVAPSAAPTNDEDAAVTVDAETAYEEAFGEYATTEA